MLEDGFGWTGVGIALRCIYREDEFFKTGRDELPILII
jgi:hypothetical protein